MEGGVAGNMSAMMGGAKGNEGAGSGGGSASAERDPLLKTATKKLGQMPDVDQYRGRTSVHISCLTAGPISFYIGAVVCIYQHFFHTPMACLVVLFTLAALAVLLTLLAGKTKWIIRTGVLMFCAVLVGCCVGFYNHYTNMIYYYAYGDMRKYTNVGGSERASQFSDAGMISFTSTTQVDVEDAVGYRSRENDGVVYCVAPVRDATPGHKINFWAVGKNCCDMRKNFRCDEAGTGANQALVLLTPEVLVSPSMEWVLEGLQDREQYEKAIVLQEAEFEDVTATDHVFIRWTKDAGKLKDHYRELGIHTIIVSTLLYFAISLAVAIFTEKAPSRVR